MDRRPRHGNHGALAISAGGQRVAFAVILALANSLSLTFALSLALAEHSDNVTEAGSQIVSHTPWCER